MSDVGPPQARAPRRGWVGWSLVAVVVVLAASTLAPAALGLSMRTPWAQLVQLRVVAGALALALAVLLAVVARLLHRGRPHRPRPRRLPVLVLVLLLVAAGHGGVLVARSLTAPEEAPAPGEGDLVVVALNVGIGGTAAGDVVALAVRQGADVLALSEAGPELATAVADGLAAAGRPAAVLCSSPGGTGEVVDGDGERPGRFSLLPFVRPAVCLLVDASLGPYTAVAGPPLRGGSVVARPTSGDGPPLAVVHTLPPVPGAFDMGLWRAETQASAALCGQLDGGVVAGDLNATEDHAVLRDLAGCTLAVPAGRGTWPSSLPVELASRIDHVLLDPGRWRVRGTSVEAVEGSDHRAVVAVLRER